VVVGDKEECIQYILLSSGQGGNYSQMTILEWYCGGTNGGMVFKCTSSPSLEPMVESL